MNKKILGILVSMLLIITAVPAVGTINIAKTKMVENNIQEENNIGQNTMSWSSRFIESPMVTSEYTQAEDGKSEISAERKNNQPNDGKEDVPKETNPEFEDNTNTPLELSPANVRVYINSEPQNECSIAVNPTKPDNIVIGFNDYTTGTWTPSYSYSTDGGSSWTYGGSVPTGSLSGDPFCDPWLAFDNDGYCYYVALSDTSNHEVFVCVGAPDGSGNVGPSGFGNPQTVDNGVGAKNDKCAIAVDKTDGAHDGNIYVVWSRCTGTVSTDGYRIYFRRGTRSGTTITWQPSQLVGPDTFTQGAQVAVGPNGEVYVAYLRMTSSSIPTGNAILISKSTNGGSTFSTIGTLVSNVDAVSWYLSGASEWARHASFPTLGVSMASGTVFVAWADDRNEDDDILLSRSTTGGTSWSAPIRVNDDTVSNGKDQWHPALTVTPSGYVHVIFYDRRDSATNKYTHLYHARSTNDGVSFSNSIVTSAVTNPDAFSWWASGSLGDYVGIDSAATLKDCVYLTWGDGRYADPWPKDYNSEVFFEKYCYWIPLIPDFILYDPWWWLKNPPFIIPEIDIEILRVYNLYDYVYLYLEGLPQGTEYWFEPPYGIPPFSSKLHIECPEDLEGEFELTVIAKSVEYQIEKKHTMDFTLTLKPFVLLETARTNPGRELELRGHGFTKDSFFDVFFDNKLIGREETDNMGSFAAKIKIPSNTPDGAHTIRVKDKDGSEASTTVYTPQGETEGEEIKIEFIPKLFSLAVSANIHNEGEGPEDLDWAIDLEGLVFKGKHTEGELSLKPGAEEPISTEGLLCGIGPVSITASAEAISKKASCFLLGPFVILLRGKD